LPYKKNRNLLIPFLLGFWQASKQACLLACLLVCLLACKKPSKKGIKKICFFCRAKGFSKSNAIAIFLLLELDFSSFST